VEANGKIELLEKQQAQLYAVLMAKQPQQQKVSPVQDSTAATIKVLTDKINQLESGSGGGGGNGGRGGYRKMGSKSYPRNNDGVRTTRRWDNDHYCWACGYHIKHTSMTCVYITDTANHRREATATNSMNGSTRNLHLRP
jgi:hypothetical protein